jgi:ATP synthase protein I
MEEIIINRSTTVRLVYVQLIITFVIACLAYAFFGLISAYSVLLGSAIYILPNIYFVRYAFKAAKSQTPQSMLNWFYFGEVQKFLLTAVMFALCFTYIKPLHVVSIFAAYILVMIVNLATLAILSKTEKI